jgi:hypothetical protein
MREILSDIHSHEATYQPNAKVRQEMQRHTAVSVLGLLSTQRIVRALPIIDPAFATAKQFTTRKPRVGEPADAFRFRSGAPKGLKRVLDEVKTGKLTGFSIDQAGSVYGSAAEDIAPDAPYTLLSVPRSVASRRQFTSVPWGRRVEFMVIPELSDYTTQMRRQLHGVNENSKQSRIHQNNTKLSWALAQSDNLIWVPYDYKAPEATADYIASIARGETEPDALYRDVGLELAQSLKVA